MTSIGWGILNRVSRQLSGRASGNRGSAKPYYDVIFARGQFRTSFSGKKKDPNPFATAFLCPHKARDYSKGTPKSASADSVFGQAEKIADQLIKGFEANGIPEKYKGITNFFYPHSEFFGEKRPTWARNQNPVQNKGYIDLGWPGKPCVEFYALGSNPQ
jgi:hypothetical protein